MTIATNIAEILSMYGSALALPDPEQVQAIVDSLQKEALAQQKKNNQTSTYVGAAKRRFVVENTSWGPTLEERLDPDFELGAAHGEKVDKLREASGKYWSYNKEDSNTGKPQEVKFIAKGGEHDTNSNVPFNTIVSAPEFISSAESFGGERDPFFQVQQGVLIAPNQDMFKDEQGNYRSDNWHTLITGLEGENATGNSGIIDEYVEYNYLAFDMPLPFNYNELDKLNVAGPQYVRSDAEYNFYIKSYEEQFRFGMAANQPEHLLPNLYAMMMEKHNETSNKHFADHISLNGALTESETTTGAATKKFEIKKHSGQYFDIFGRRVEDALTKSESSVPELNGALKGVVDKYTNLVVPESSVPILREMSRKKELFPMFVDMEFSTDRMTEFAQMLSDTKLLDEFMWSFIKDIVTIGGHTNMDFTEVEEVSNVEVMEDGTSVVKKHSVTRTETRKTWNILDSWLKKSSLVDFSTGVLNPADKVGRAFQEALAMKSTLFLDDGATEKELQADSSKKFFKSLLGIIFVGKLKTFLKNRFVTYDKMLEGQTCHSEDVMYRIEKSLADTSGNPTGNVLQNFWFPNTNEIDTLNFVDTQIKYGKRYAYKLYVYKIAVNTKYSYSELGVWNSGAAFVVTQKPEALLIEEEIFLDNHTILDDPPIPPEVEVVPYFADGNKILFNMKSAVGEYVLDPILLNLEDIGQHDDIRRSQKLEGTDKIRFKGDDKGGSFEIYKIEDRPKNWDDFDNRMLTAVSNTNASTGEFVDYISSNKKYYYTFRMVDVHGHVSNPTEIYEIELVNDEGSVYLNKRIVELAPREPKNPCKPMRRLLQIKVAPEQRFLDLSGEEESALDVKNLKLGQLQESPWGRKFKFRIVSRKTGKKMDFNVDFKAEMDKGSALK